jgi:hypothetical protein
VVTAPAYADELTFTLNSIVGYGAPTNLNPDPNFCASPNCVLFTGTLMDNDVDPSPDNNPSFLYIFSPYTKAADAITFDGVLSLDNTAPLGTLSGDTNYATDGLSNPPNIYRGPIFGVDIPTGTPAGEYVDAVYLDIYPSNGNDPFTISADVTVIVSPEPAPGCLLAGGLAALAVWCWVRRKCDSSESSR